MSKSAKALFSFLMMFLISNKGNGASPNVNAPSGGKFISVMGAEPPTLHPIIATDLYGMEIIGYACDSLLTRDVETYEWKPALAASWEISKDGKVFTFKLQKNIFFHDGKPITAEDVKFSLDTINDPAYQGLASHLVSYFEGIEKAEVIDNSTVKFYMKDTYFKNFETVATLTVIPKHIYGNVDKAKKLTKSLICSGAYTLEKFDRGQKILLKKFNKWYGFSIPLYKGYYNFENIEYRFYSEETVQIERLKKGDIDFLGSIRAESFVKKAVGPQFGKTVFKYRVENNSPKSYDFVGWNLKHHLFQDKKVRIALAHLMNRTEMNKKFREGLSDLATSPIYIKSEYSPPNLKPFLFDPKKAQELLTQSGWTDSDKDGVLDKMMDDKKIDFRFTLIHANKDREKYWTFYKEDLKKAGIVMEIKFIEWNSFLKSIDDGAFDAITMGWGGGSVDPDPKQIWHSESAVKGGSNFIGYKNVDVDKLIDEARFTLDKPKRVKLLRQVYEKIADDAPYVFMFNDKYSYYAHSARVKKPAETFKYGLGVYYWWMAP